MGSGDLAVAVPMAGDRKYGRVITPLKIGTAATARFLP